MQRVNEMVNGEMREACLWLQIHLLTLQELLMQSEKTKQ